MIYNLLCLWNSGVLYRNEMYKLINIIMRNDSIEVTSAILIFAVTIVTSCWIIIKCHPCNFAYVW